MKGRRDKPSAAEFGRLRAYLAQHVSQQQINEAVGASVGGRTRGEIAEQLRAWLRDRPKG